MKKVFEHAWILTMDEQFTQIRDGWLLVDGKNIEAMGEAEGQHSDMALLERIADIVRRDLPHLTVSSIENAKNWGSEDISIMMNRVQALGGQATYMRVMTPMAGAQHTVKFDFDEIVLERSVQVFCAAAMDVLG